MTPAIFFCTTCKGRVQHIEKTLPQNLTDNKGATFILLDYGSPDHLRSYIKSHHMDDIASGRLIVYSYEYNGPFRMAHAKNMAHRLAILEGADILCNLDADNYTGKDFASYIGGKFRAMDDGFLWAKMIKDTKGRLPRGISGRIVVTTKTFLNAGGYDEKYADWGPDDKDFTVRVERLGYVPHEIDQAYLQAIPHNDKMRFKDYKHAATDIDEDQFHKDITESTTTVVNYGNIGCGVVYRNFDFTTPIKLEPLPTRIFGIGMHKTGTTSLHTALTILGYDSAHWKSARWARNIWEEMEPGYPLYYVPDARSRTLERHYALCDLPIPLLYKQLDRAYPGSKFILTIRDEKNWLQSVRNHWDHTKNKFRAGWNDDPFTHRVHKLLYGQKGFDADLFLARYRRHNSEVLEYFKDRPDDLLVMNMDMNVAQWLDLCNFLNRDIPEQDYPIAFPTPKVIKEHHHHHHHHRRSITIACLAVFVIISAALLIGRLVW